MRTFGDLSGNRLPYASKTVINGGIFYELPTSVGDFDANLNVTYNSGFTFEPSEAAKQKAFADVAATFGWTLSNGTTRISVFGRNLANEKVVRTYAGGANPGGYIEAQYRDPRTYGVAISQKF